MLKINLDLLVKGTNGKDFASSITESMTNITDTQPDRQQDEVRAVVVNNGGGIYISNQGELDTIINYANSQNPPIHLFTAYYYDGASGTSYAEETMRELAYRTGGKYYRPSTPEELSQAYSNIADTLKTPVPITFTITASAGTNGAISPAGVTTVNYGGSQTYTITPDIGYHVVDVLVNGVSVGPVTSYQFPSVTADQTISATFAIDTFTITASAGTNGAISPAGVTTVNYGGSQTYTITPDIGYHVVDVLVKRSIGGTSNKLPVSGSNCRSDHFSYICN